MKPGAFPGPSDLERILIGELGLPLRRTWYVAFSGGLDSSVLLHALRELRESLGLDLCALHAHHGLHPQADDWLSHCAAICRNWEIEFRQQRLSLTGGERSLEERAREARYAWFQSVMGSGSVLLTAHHQDDQAETLLANLVRGAGVHGLAAIPARASLGDGMVARPLLGVSRDQIHRYARQHALRWVEDDSNRDLRIKRNFIRHRVMPLLGERWSGVSGTLARTARHMREASLLLDSMASDDLAAVASEETLWGTRLDVQALAGLDGARQRNALRYWFRRSGHQVPGTRHLDMLWRQMVLREPRSTAVLRWPLAELRRYRRWLYLSAPMADIAPQARRWCWHEPLGLPTLGLLLRAVPVTGDGIALTRLPDCLDVNWRRGGEWLRLPGRRHRQRLKKVLQSADVPPWYRDRIPLLCIDDEIAAVAGRWYCEPFAARTGEAGIAFILQRADGVADSLT